MIVQLYRPAFYHNYLFKGSISKYSHNLIYWGVRTSTYEFLPHYTQQPIECLSGSYWRDMKRRKSGASWFCMDLFKKKHTPLAHQNPLKKQRKNLLYYSRSSPSVTWKYPFVENLFRKQRKCYCCRNFSNIRKSNWMFKWSSLLVISKHCTEEEVYLNWLELSGYNHFFSFFFLFLFVKNRWQN